MFADGFLSITLEGMLGLLVTAVGIWFVVQQLREAKLAAQMDGVLSLTDRFMDMTDDISLVDELALDKDWAQLSGRKAYSRYNSNKVLKSAIINLSKFYELVAVLVQSGALDISFAEKLYGELVARRWHLVRNVVYAIREEFANSFISSEWEWLALEFEKRNQ
jgi:hypothetical protein